MSGEFSRVARDVDEAGRNVRAAALALANAHREGVAIKLHRIANDLGGLAEELRNG